MTPHRRQVLKCMDKKITKPLKLADFVREPAYRRSKRKNKTRKIPLKPPRREKLIVKMPFKKKGVTTLSALPVKKEPIKYAEHY